MESSLTDNFLVCHYMEGHYMLPLVETLAKFDKSTWWELSLHFLVTESLSTDWLTDIGRHIIDGQKLKLNFNFWRGPTNSPEDPNYF